MASIILSMACNIPQLGAFIKGTTTYIYPAIANKTDKYTCPECENDLIFKQGQLRAHHFAHYKSDNPCNYYTKPSEAQVHKDAKTLLKVLLESGTTLTIRRACGTYHSGPNPNYEDFEIPVFSDTSHVALEYRFDYNGLKIADVAYIDNGEIVCIFEICNTHKTSSDSRPEPWFEIHATDFIHQVNSENTNTIQCIRKIPCDDCTPIACKRCGVDCPRHIIELINSIRKYTICTSCNREIIDNIYFNIPYSDKETIKVFGGRFDGYYKHWYVDKSNKQLPLIISKWHQWVPT